MRYESPVMSSKFSKQWNDDFLGIAYRYFDLRMNVSPLFSARAPAVHLWQEVIHWWPDYSIKLRFVEIDDRYWFILGADSRRPDTNVGFYKILDRSESYERFKKGHDGEAYLRLGTYSKQYKKDVKDDAMCDCGHEMIDHGETPAEDDCLYEDCSCKKFESFEVKLLKKKKIITDIEFISESEAKDDALAWNCLNANRYSKV